MPIQYNDPREARHIQSYVSQDVDLPFEEMQQSLDRKTAQYNAGVAMEDAAIEQFINSQGLQKDKEALAEIIGGYSAELQDIVQKDKGDYSLSGTKLRQVARNIQTNKARGRLGAIERNYAAANKYNQELQKRFAAGDIGRDRMNDLYRISMGQYQGVGDEDRALNDYNTFNGITAVSQVNIDEKVDEYMKEFAANSGGSVRITKGKGGLTGYMHKVGNTWKQITPEEIRAYVEPRLRNDRDVMEDLNQSAMIQSTDDPTFDSANWISNQINGGAERGGMKFGYSQTTEDESIQKDWLFEYGLKKADEQKALDEGIGFEVESTHVQNIDPDKLKENTTPEALAADSRAAGRRMINSVLKGQLDNKNFDPEGQDINMAINKLKQEYAEDIARDLPPMANEETIEEYIVEKYAMDLHYGQAPQIGLAPSSPELQAQAGDRYFANKVSQEQAIRKNRAADVYAQGQSGMSNDPEADKEINRNELGLKYNEAHGVPVTFENGTTDNLMFTGEDLAEMASVIKRIPSNYSGRAGNFLGIDSDVAEFNGWTAQRLASSKEGEENPLIYKERGLGAPHYFHPTEGGESTTYHDFRFTNKDGVSFTVNAADLDEGSQMSKVLNSWQDYDTRLDNYNKSYKDYVENNYNTTKTTAMATTQIPNMVVPDGQGGTEVLDMKKNSEDLKKAINDHARNLQWSVGTNYYGDTYNFETAIREAFNLDDEETIDWKNLNYGDGRKNNTGAFVSDGGMNGMTTRYPYTVKVVYNGEEKVISTDALKVYGKGTQMSKAQKAIRANDAIQQAVNAGPGSQVYLKSAPFIPTGAGIDEDSGKHYIPVQDENGRLTKKYVTIAEQRQYIYDLIEQAENRGL